MTFEYANVEYGSITFKNKKVIAFSKCYSFLDTLYIQYEFHKILTICYVVMAEDGKIIEI